jgi:hypothetical protein
MKMVQTDCAEMSAYKIQTLGNYPEENIQEHSFMCAKAASAVLLWKDSYTPKKYDSVMEQSILKNEICNMFCKGT